MIKRLLNPHTLLKITLILTTLLLLPASSWATSFFTSGNITGSGNSYTWTYSGTKTWAITTTQNDVTLNTSNAEYLNATITNGGNITLTTTRPVDYTCYLTGIRLAAQPNTTSFTNCSIILKFQGSDEQFVLNTDNTFGDQYYNFDIPQEWTENKPIEVIISQDNSTSSASCIITRITLYTKQRSTATFTWPESPTPKSGNNDVGSFKKVVVGDNGLQLQGHCLNKTEFNFPLECNTSVNITYSSNSSDVAEIDENTGVVRVNGKGQATITATPEASEDIFYEQSSYSYTLDITSIDGLCIDGTFVNFNNKDNIQCDAIKEGKVSYNSQYQTLTLDGVTIDGTISSSIDGLKIDLKGENAINTTQSDSSAIQTWDGAGEINLVIGSTNTPKGTLTMTTPNRETIYGYKVSYSDNIIGADYDHYSCIGEDYNLTIAQKAVNSVNASNVLRDGYQSASYDYSSSTLTLKGANLESEDITIGEGINTLNIQLIGYNQVSNIISSNSATTINVTTSETLPGSLHYYGSIPETIVLKNNLRQDNREICVDMNNTTYTPFTGYVDYATESFIYCGTPDYNVSLASFSNKTVIVSSPNDGTTATLYPSSISNLNLIKKVYFQFDWGTCANKNVSLQIRGIKQNTETYNYEFDGKTYSENVSLNTTYEDGIVEIPITGTITSPNIELYFTSNATFSFVPLAVAMENYESYDISFNNELVSELNKNDIFGDGKASYDPEGHILTLKGVDLKPNGPSEVVGWNYMGNKNLTVILEDENTITNALFYNRGGYPDVNIRFFTETTKPGSLTMKKTGDSNPSVFNQENYIRSFKNIVYDNTYYDYSTSGNEAEGYTGIYKVSLLKPEINCEETEDGVQLYISDPSESNGTIKYSVVYGDGSEGITDAEYSESPEVPTIEKPATITAYIESGDKKSGTITAYYFGFADDLKTTFNGTEREILKDEFPALIPSVEGIDYMLSNSDNPNAICLKTVDEVDHIMIKGFGTANLILNINHNANIIVLNSGDGAIALKAKVIPSAPTFSVVAGTYDETQTLELTSQYQKSNSDDQTVVNIKYYTSEDPNKHNPYTAPITIDHTTTITAWVEALITSAAGGTQETITSDTITQEYIIKEEAFIDFMQEENDKYITIEAGQVITGTYGNTIPQVVMPSISDLHGTITFSSSNETVVASSSISLDEENKLKYTVSGAGQTTIQASYTPTEEEPILPTTSSFNLKIEPRAITNATISMGTNGETSFVYKGTAIDPITSVSLAASETAVAATLNAETDFDLNYYMVSGETETEQEGAPTNVGSYKVTVNAKGNYTGSKSATFTITPATITPKVVITGWAYGATANTPTVSGNTGNGSVTYEYKLQNAEDSKYSTEVPTEAGDYTIKATIAATTNYEAAVDSTHFTIAKANIAPTVTLEGWTFGATAKTPSISGNTGNGNVTYEYKLQNAEDSKYSTEIPNEAGYYTIKATIAATANYEAAVDSTHFTISKANIAPTVTLEGWTFGATAKTPSISGNTGNGSVTYEYKLQNTEDSKYSTEIPNEAGYYTIKAAIAATANYEAAVDSTHFTISKANITPTITLEGWTFGATAKTPSISGNTGNGSVTYEYKLQNAEDSKYSTEVPNEAGDYTIKATIAATTNYEAAVDSTHFTISKANINPTVTLVGWTFGATANTPEVTGNTGNGAETFTYKAEGSEAFTSEVPTAVGTHIVKVTIAETTNYNGGEATATFTIINRTFNPANDITFAEGQTYASFYSSSEDLELPEEGIAVFMITGLNGNTLTTQAVSYIPKGVPVLIEKTETAVETMDPSEIVTNMLQYATSDVNADGTTYILYNGEYVRATGTIPAGKCYLKLNKPSGARALTIGNETTGIDRLDNTVWATENWFDLNGRRIEKPTKKGLYIMNGKKVVVK